LHARGILLLDPTNSFQEDEWGIGFEHHRERLDELKRVLGPDTVSRITDEAFWEAKAQDKQQPGPDSTPTEHHGASPD
jgi:hypothetical protein